MGSEEYKNFIYTAAKEIKKYCITEYNYKLDFSKTRVIRKKLGLINPEILIYVEDLNLYFNCIFIRSKEKILINVFGEEEAIELNYIQKE